MREIIAEAQAIGRELVGQRFKERTTGRIVIVTGLVFDPDVPQARVDWGDMDWRADVPSTVPLADLEPVE